MFASTRPSRRLFVPLALLAVLAVTTGWSGSARATSHLSAASFHASSRVAGATDSVAAATAASRAPERDAAWDAAAEARTAVVPDRVINHRRAFTDIEVVPEPPPPAPVKVKAPKPSAPAPAPAPKEKPKPTYRGTNHFWIPSLGMSYGVRWYACGRTSTPGNHIYRWGCAGRNNVYLLGHAWGVMKPLHDLYVRGGLRRGMVAIYADASGRVRKYRVTEWRVVRPTEVAWQIAAQPVPSMTLQTCIGKYSQYRLNVRLVVVK